MFVSCTVFILCAERRDSTSAWLPRRSVAGVCSRNVFPCLSRLDLRHDRTADLIVDGDGTLRLAMRESPEDVGNRGLVQFVGPPRTRGVALFHSNSALPKPSSD